MTVQIHVNPTAVKSQATPHTVFSDASEMQLTAAIQVTHRDSEAHRNSLNTIHLTAVFLKLENNLLKKNPGTKVNKYIMEYFRKDRLDV